MSQPLPRTVVDATIHALEGAQRLAFLDRPDLHREIAEVLVALYEYRVYMSDSGHPQVPDEEKLRIAYEAGRTAADFEETLERINATMTADTTALAADLDRLAQDRPEPADG